MNSTAELDPLAQMTTEDLDDLGNLFEFGDIDLNNIPSVDSGQYSDQLQQQQQRHPSHPNTPFHDMSQAPPLQDTAPHGYGGHEQFGVSRSLDQQRAQHFMAQHDGHVPTSHPYTTEPMYQPSMQQPYHPHPQNFQFQPQQGFPPGHHIPPTPNSYEMHGETGRFMHQLDPQQRAILEQRFHVRKDDAIAFTPMVSPAGTPQYHILPEFTTPGAYFSPLTSPALHAQNASQQQFQQQQQQGYLTNPSTAPSSNGTSPIDPSLDVDMLGDGLQLPESAGPQGRKSRRKIATPRSLATSAKTKPSPTQKPGKRKSGTMSSIVHTNSNDSFSQRSATSQPASAGLQMPSQFDSSEAESISPEPMSESLMRPPPRPGSSLNQSPSIAGQRQDSRGSTVGPAATPKSLLTMRSSQQPINDQQGTPGSSSAPQEPGGLDDLALPEAATRQHPRRPSLTQINTQISPSDIDIQTPRLSARKTPKLGPLSTPSSARPTSALASPSMAGSPMTASTPAGFLKDKKDAKGSRGNKKRGSVSANGSKLVSPALVPKISPSIKPLLPEGSSLNSATQAIILASKSNYQNILEGTHLPGVTYPDFLSTGLTSKRTSHKVAEQGRRNRINDALKEMQALIPKPTAAQKAAASKEEAADGADGSNSPEEGADEDKRAEGNSKESKEEASARSNNSKAATVELANDYIRRMQTDNAIKNADILFLRRENEGLRRKLVEQVAGVGGAGMEEKGSDMSSPG